METESALHHRESELRRDSALPFSFLNIGQRVRKENTVAVLTMVKELAACSRSPTSPLSLKYFPVQIPSSSGETTSSDTALSSSTF